MKKHTFSLFLFLVASILHAQVKVGDFTFKYGTELENDSKKIVRIAGELDGKIYALANKKNDFFIKIFSSSDMSLITVKAVDLSKYKNKSIDFEDIALIGNKVYVFGSVYDKKEKISNLFGTEVLEDGTLSNTHVRLFSTKVTKRRERGAFYFKSSPYGDRLLVMHAAVFEKEDLIQYEVKLLDENLDYQMATKEEVPFKDRRDLEFSIADFEVSYNDDVFLVVNESYWDRKTKTNNEKFQVHLFKSENNYKKEVIDIEFKDKEVINCEMLSTNKGKMNLVGFYSAKSKNGRMMNRRLRGVYSSVVDINTKEVERLSFNEFDYDTKVKLIGERRAKKGKDVTPSYFTHSLIEKQDGGLILLSEYQQIIESTGGGIGPLAVTSVTFVNNEIIVTSLNPDGTVAWTNVIAKKQQASYTTLHLGIFGFSNQGNFTVGAGIYLPVTVLGKGPEYLSAMPIYHNGKLTVIFNDNPKNQGITDIEEIRSMGNYNKAVPAAITFNDDGTFTRYDQKDIQDKQLVLRPRVFLEKNPSEYIIYSSRKKQDKLGRMTIDKNNN